MICNKLEKECYGSYRLLIVTMATMIPHISSIEGSSQKYISKVYKTFDINKEMLLYISAHGKGTPIICLTNLTLVCSNGRKFETE